jgi:hypothetical protein
MAFMEELMNKIEILRHTMEDLSSLNGIKDPKVIALSQQLDNLLNEYYRLCHRYSMLKWCTDPDIVGCQDFFIIIFLQDGTFLYIILSKEVNGQTFWKKGTQNHGSTDESLWLPGCIKKMQSGNFLYRNVAEWSYWTRALFINTNLK